MPTLVVAAPAAELPAPQPAAAEPVPEVSDLREADEVEPSADDSTPSARAQDKRRALARDANAPEDLLQKANQSRAAGRFRDAAQTYSLVYDRFPRSQAAYVARVAAAALELEHLSNPLKARKLFELALQERPKGALDLEARQGLSVALRDLEDRAGEREALRSLVTRHPGSPAARRAQVRLMELGGE
jgi:tetratricopeptide (TPR) repeat protein